MLTVFDRIWVLFGLDPMELRKDRSRGVFYIVMLLTLAASVGLVTDMVLNLSGRFG